MNKEQADWSELIKEYRASGLSAAAWCRENNLKLHQLRYRLDKAKDKKKAAPKWLPLEAAEPETETLKIQIGPATIEVKPGFNPAMLAAVVRTLQSI